MMLTVEQGSFSYKKDQTIFENVNFNLYSGEILMFSNSRDAFGLTLKRLGYDINTQDKHELDHAAAELKAQKQLLESFVIS